MATKYTIASSTNTGDRLAPVIKAARQLSDGTLIALYSDGAASPVVKLGYSSDHSTWNDIATVSTNVANGFYCPQGGLSSLILTRDSLDNIFVAGWDNARDLVRAKAYTKGAGYTWTAQTSLVGTTSNANGSGAEFNGLWCNTGGGTNSKGHIIAAGRHSSSGNQLAWTLDAGALLAGSGTLEVNAYNNTGIASHQNGTMTGISAVWEFSPDGFGATSGLWISQQSNNSPNFQLAVGKWSVSSLGVITDGYISQQGPFLDWQSKKARVVRYASNRWAVFVPDSGGTKVTVALYSSTAKLVGFTTYGTVTNWPSLATTLNWDAIADSVLTNTVWLYGWSTATASTMLRLSLNCASDVITWGSVATVDDTSVGSGTNSTIRGVKEPTSGINYGDWQTLDTNGSTLSLLGDYTFFDTAPTLTQTTADASVFNTATPTLAVAVTDPDPSQTLTTTFEVATDSGFGSIIYTGTATIATPQAAGAVTKTTTALTKGVTLYWRARVSDGTLTSANTATRTFIIYDDPTVTIGASTPATTTSTGGPTLNVGWTYGQGQSLAEAFYRVQVQTNGGATTYYDSGTLAGPATSVALDAVALGIPTDTTGTALQVVVTVTAATTGTVVSATKTFDIQWGVVTVGIVSPSNGAIIATTSITAQWTFASTRSKLQGSYRIRLMIASTGSVLLDTGFVTSAATSAVVAVTLVDGSTYSLEVTLKNDQGVLGT